MAARPIPIPAAENRCTLQNCGEYTCGLRAYKAGAPAGSPEALDLLQNANRVTRTADYEATGVEARRGHRATSSIRAPGCTY